MPNERKSSKTPAEWIALAQRGKEVWNKHVALLQPNDFIDFRDADFSNPIDFSGYHFPVETDFMEVRFQRDAVFTDTQFASSVAFNKTEFKGEVTFCDAKFRGDAFFQETVFCKKESFDRAVFSKTAHFYGAEFKHWAEFNGVQFQELVNFTNAKFTMFANFRNAVFHDILVLKGVDLHSYITFNHSTDFDRQFLYLKGKDAEITYRELKLRMKRIEAHAEENAFFQLEMLTRKSQEPWPRKGLYWLYELLSNYGQSIILPAMWLGVFFLVFLWFYHLSPQSIGLGEGYGGYVNALQLALKGAFILPGMFSGGALEKIQLSGFGIILAGFHWLLSAASWFLMLLGLRNRFRLK